MREPWDDGEIVQPAPVVDSAPWDRGEIVEPAPPPADQSAPWDRGKIVEPAPAPWDMGEVVEPPTARAVPPVDPAAAPADPMAWMRDLQDRRAAEDSRNAAVAMGGAAGHELMMRERGREGLDREQHPFAWEEEIERREVVKDALREEYGPMWGLVSAGKGLSSMWEQFSDTKGVGILYKVAGRLMEATGNRLAGEDVPEGEVNRRIRFGQFLSEVGQGARQMVEEIEQASAGRRREEDPLLYQGVGMTETLEGLSDLPIILAVPQTLPLYMTEGGFQQYEANVDKGMEPGEAATRATLGAVGSYAILKAGLQPGRIPAVQRYASTLNSTQQAGLSVLLAGAGTGTSMSGRELYTWLVNNRMTEMTWEQFQEETDLAKTFVGGAFIGMVMQGARMGARKPASAAGESVSARSEVSDAYKLLKVKRGVSPRELREARREAVKRVHPDKNPNNPNAAEELLAIRKAYETVLADAVRSSEGKWWKRKSKPESRKEESSSPTGSTVEYELTPAGRDAFEKLGVFHLFFQGYVQDELGQGLASAAAPAPVPGTLPAPAQRAMAEPGGEAAALGARLGPPQAPVRDEVAEMMQPAIRDAQAAEAFDQEVRGAGDQLRGELPPPASPADQQASQDWKSDVLDAPVHQAQEAIQSRVRKSAWRDIDHPLADLVRLINQPKGKSRLFYDGTMNEALWEDVPRHFKRNRKEYEKNSLIGWTWQDLLERIEDDGPQSPLRALLPQDRAPEADDVLRLLTLANKEFVAEDMAELAGMEAMYDPAPVTREQLLESPAGVVYERFGEPLNPDDPGVVVKLNELNNGDVVRIDDMWYQVIDTGKVKYLRDGQEIKLEGDELFADHVVPVEHPMHPELLAAYQVQETVERSQPPQPTQPPPTREDFTLETVTPEQLEAEELRRKQREEILKRQQAPLTGDSRGVGQGQLFDDPNTGGQQDLLGGLTAEAEAARRALRPSETGTDPVPTVGSELPPPPPELGQEAVDLYEGRAPANLQTAEISSLQTEIAAGASPAEGARSAAALLRGQKNASKRAAVIKELTGEVVDPSRASVDKVAKALESFAEAHPERFPRGDAFSEVERRRDAGRKKDGPGALGMKVPWLQADQKLVTDQPSPLESANPEVTARLDVAAKAPRKRTTLAERKEQLRQIGRSFVRTFPELEDKHGLAHALLMSLPGRKVYAMAQAQDNVRTVTDGLGPDQYRLFEQILAARDVVQSIEDGLYVDVELPFGWKTLQEVQQDLERWESVAAQNPMVANALESRGALWERVRNLAVDNGILDEYFRQDRGYFHRIVLKHLEDVSKRGSGLKETKSSFQMRRKGGSDFVIDYATAETEVLADIYHQIGLKEVRDQFKEAYDVTPQQKQVARHMNLERVHGGAENYRRVQQVLERLRELQGVDGAGKEREALKKSIEDIDVLRPFRQQKAIAISMWERAAGESFPSGVDPNDVMAEAKRTEGPLAAAASVWNRAITAEEEFIKKQLGRNYHRWKQGVGDEMIPEGYEKVEIKSGHIMYRTLSVDQAVVDKVLNDAIELAPEHVREVLAVAAKHQPWIVPADVAKAIQHLNKDAGRFDPVWDAISKLTTLWSGNKLMNPRHTVPYNLRNLFSDLEMAAQFPGIYKLVPKAVPMVYDYYRKGGGISPLMKEMMELGVMGGQSHAELGDMSRSRFMSIVTGDDPGLLEKYLQENQSWSDTRENILRVAAYMYFLDQVQKGRRIYGGSVRQHLDDLYDRGEFKLAAAQLAKDTLHDYQNPTRFGHSMRHKAGMPFFRFREANTIRILRIFANIGPEVDQAMKDSGDGRGAGRQKAGKYARAFGEAGMRGGAKALKWGKRVWLLNLFYALVQSINQAVDPEEARKLRKLGKGGTLYLGNGFSFNADGAMVAFLRQVGIQEPLSDLQAFLDGSKSVYDTVKRGLMAEAANTINPGAKAVLEHATGTTFWPDPSQGRPLRDPVENYMRLISADRLYRRVTGRPLTEQERSISGTVTSWLVRTSDLEADAYWATRRMVRDHLRAQGKSEFIGGRVRNDGGVGEARNNFFQAMRYGDEAAARRWILKYSERGGAMQDLQRSHTNRHPLHGIPVAERVAFFNSLSPEDRRLVLQADDYWKRQAVPSAPALRELLRRD